MGHEVNAVSFHALALPLQHQLRTPLDVRRRPSTVEVDRASLELADDMSQDEEDPPQTKARSLTSGAMKHRPKPMAKPIRKSVSECVLFDASSSNASFPPTTHAQSHLHTAAARTSSLRQTPDDEDDALLASIERSTIIQSANEILRRKQLVGIQVGETCPVCLCDDVDTQLTNCGHRVHAKCIKRWIESGSQCPVCRELVTGIEGSFVEPVHHEIEKDLAELSPQDAAAALAMASPDDGAPRAAYEWGWFEDFDDMHDTDDESVSLSSFKPRPRRASLCSDISSRVGGGAPLMSRVTSQNFEVCRTFPPLDETIDTPYSESKYAWIRALPSHRHISVQIKIRCFRIVQSTATNEQFAEYKIEVTLNGRNTTKWRRYSALHRFVSSLPTSQYQRTHAVWTTLASSARWFNRLEVKYLDQRCKMLEDFAHELLQDSTSAHVLGDLLEL